MKAEPQMAKGPTPKEKKVKVLGYRAPPDIEEWVASKMTDGASQSDVMAWAMRMAHDYYEASRTFHSRINALAKTHGMTQLGIMRRIVAAGVEALEAELKK